MESKLHTVWSNEAEEKMQPIASRFLQTSQISTPTTESFNETARTEFVTSNKPPHSVRIIDADENLLFTDSASLGRLLGCPPDLKLKSLVIVGNTGDGKSHTLNHAFCEGQTIFVTSASQSTCTLGVWAAYEPEKGYLLLDTEGLLGACSNPNRQRRLLLKVFAIADVVIYRTMSDRLHSDMFTFLADASDAFAQHFRPELENLAHKSALPWSSRQLGPAVLIFQETQHTEPLDVNTSLHGVDDKSDKKCASFLTDRFSAIHRNADAFSSLSYCGVRTITPPTNFSPLISAVDELMQDTTVRSPRLLSHIHKLLASLNDNFACDLPDSDALTFVQEYFTCPVKCISCQARCRLGVNHTSEDVPHESRSHMGDGCQYDASLQNKVYYCKKCYANGKTIMLVPKYIENCESTVTGLMKYIWAGYLLKCPIHSVVYRSRALWSGNPPPEDTPDIHFQVVHVWPGEKSLLQGAHPVGQLVLDGLTTVTNQVTQLTAPSARVLSDLIADSVAPPYWQSNAQIKFCACCNYEFPSSSTSISPQPSLCNSSDSAPTVDFDGEKVATDVEQKVGVAAPSDDAAKHHCRSCGRGVCESCSKHRIRVPERGFDTEPVRVCDRCFDSQNSGDLKGLSTRRASAAASRSPSAKGGMASDHRAQMSPSASKTSTLSSNANNQTSGRKVIEMLSATAGYFYPVFTAPKEMVKSLARPDYWQPDEACLRCPHCNLPFGLRTPIHHCRACGCGVCSKCSQKRMPVPRRGLDWPSRVCDACFQSPNRSRTIVPNNTHTFSEVTSTTATNDLDTGQHYKSQQR